MDKYDILTAARDNKTAAVTDLLHQGADPNIRHNITPLQAAVRHGNVPMVQALLEAGAKPNTRSMMGHTALEYAMSTRMAEETMLRLVELLVSHGATVDTDGSFMHHYDIARKRKSTALLQLLGIAES